MMAVFELELGRIPLSTFKEVIRTNELLPGRRLLQDNIEAYFEVIAGAGIEDLQQLEKILKTKKKVEIFAAEHGLPVEYLTVLRRELGSYTPKPLKLSDFPEVSEELVSTLAAQGIGNTKKYFEAASTVADRHALAARTGLDEAVLLELACLADISRIGGVGPVFARLLYEIGIRSAAGIRGEPAEAIRKKCEELNNSKGYTGVSLGVKDIRYCQDKARFLSKSFEL